MDDFKQLANWVMDPIKKAVDDKERLSVIKQRIDEAENALPYIFSNQYKQGWDDALKEVYRNATSKGIGGHK